MNSDKCNQNNNDYLALCYHYIRPKKEDDAFPRILGSRVDVFRKHIEMLKRNYEIISIDDAFKFSHSDFSFKNGRCGMLFTFDDGLSDHYLAAQILSEYGIKGIFFLPTCFLVEKLPINPIIIHYCLARYKIGGFLSVYRNALEEYKFDIDKYDVKFDKDKDDPWKTISAIKTNFRYKLGYKSSRRILLYIYKNLLLKDYPNALEIMHLTERQIKDMLNMGHSIGAHSHSHISVAASRLTEQEFKREMIMPKKYLEEIFKIPVKTFSYPVGNKQDCLTSKELINRTGEYDLAFTIEKVVNTKNTSPFELGRYMLSSVDSEKRLEGVLKAIIDRKGGII